MQVHSRAISKADERGRNYALVDGKIASQRWLPAQCEHPEFFQPRRKAMERSLQFYRKLGIALLAAITVSGLNIKAADAQGNQPGSPSKALEEPIKRTVLFRGDLEGVQGKEIVIFIAELAPGAVSSKHYHPGPEFFYVLDGTLAHEPEGVSPHTMKAGEFGSNPNKGVHIVRNPSTTERAKAIDFLVAEKEQALVIPAQ